MNGKKLRWLASCGGPLVLLHDKDREAWRGGYVYIPDRERAEIPWRRGGLVLSADYMNPHRTHYGLACACSDPVGVIDFDERKAVVLGDEPAATAWLPGRGGAGGIFVRWIHADSEECVSESLKKIPAAGWESAATVQVVAPRLVLQDAFMPGVGVAEEGMLMIELTVGAYRVSTLEYRPDSATYLRMHRLST